MVNRGYEIHLDLQSWMVEFADFMQEYSGAVVIEEDWLKHGRQAKCFKNKLNEFLVNENTGLYADYMSL